MVLELAGREAGELELVVVVVVLGPSGQRGHIDRAGGLPVVLDLAAGALDGAGDQPETAVGTPEHTKAVNVREAAQGRLVSPPKFGEKNL